MGLDYRGSIVTVCTKASLSAHAQQVSSQDVPGRLALVTCEGWNGDSNVVDCATPCSSP